MRFKLFAICLTFVTFFTCVPQRDKSHFINLSHLDYLCEDVTIAGKSMTIVHIYCDYPRYQWTDASEEGISCVDDVARAAVVYIKASELREDTLYALRIRRLLNFVLYMQTDDGEFYNFIDKNYNINTEGRTSRKSFSFWAARGYWALGAGFRFFSDIDQDYALKLRGAFRRCLVALDSLMARYQQYETVNEKSYPQWLINGYASDATSEFLLGVADYLATENDPRLVNIALKLTDGIIAMQVKHHPKVAGAFESWPGYWHAWGNAQVQALSRLAILLDRQDYLQAAEFSARAFLSRLLTTGFMHEYNFAMDSVVTFPQIAYDIRTTSLGFLQLYRATGNQDYATLAGLTASWLTGNNILGSPVYNPKSGRCYDGIDAERMNLNSGAESTIEALFTLTEICRVPAARFWLKSRPCNLSAPSGKMYQRIFCCENKKIVVSWNYDTLSYNLHFTRMQ